MKGYSSRVVRLGDGDGTLVLSDRPCLRALEPWVWWLPLDPRSALEIIPRGTNSSRVSQRRFAISLNVASAARADRFVFAVEESHAKWLGKYLQAK